MALERENVVTNVIVPIDFAYSYRVGQYLEKYIRGLGQKKLLGIKCPDCGKVVVPPRKICGACDSIMEEWVEVGPEGTVENYTVGHIKLNKGLVEKADPPTIIALIKLDGASVPLAGVLRGMEPGEVENGSRVRAVFKDPPEESLFDLDHFEPAG